jgi:DNA-binding MarR family transcriptional regulator
MKIEEEIAQLNFRDEHHKLIVNILYTASWIDLKHSQLLKKYSITPQQYNILRILRGQHPEAATINLLMNRMIDKMSNASRLVDKLKKKGLVERRQSENDRRSVDVLITNEGLKLLKGLDKKLEIEEKKILANISIKEMKLINKVLDKLRS